MMGKKDFDTTGSGDIISDPLKDNYNELVAAIYKRAIDDIISQGGAFAEDAKIFLKKNPYGLAVDFDEIINKLRGGEDEKD